MKTSLQILLASLLVSSAHAEFRTWTRNDGKTADLELVNVVEAGGEKSGEFKLRTGKTVVLKASTFADADAKLLNEWRAPVVPETPAPSVFDKFLDGNLVKLSGKSLRSYKDFTKPEKYYLFYYTASWCGPCQKFTPSLVEFYGKHKPANKDFEVILITSDEDEDSMEEYARNKQMPWPQLKLSKVEKFKREINHPGSGIPNLVLTDLQGNLIKTSYDGNRYLGPHVVMQHLETLLK